MIVLALRIMVLAMKSDEKIALVAAARRVIDEHSRIVKNLCKYGTKSVVCDGTMIIKDGLMEQRNCIGEPSDVLFKKALADRGFDSRYKQFVDLEMWFHLLEQGKLAYLNDPLFAFRVHPLQETSSNISRNIHLDERFQLINDYADKLPLQIRWAEKQYTFPYQACLAGRHRISEAENPE